MGKADTVPRQKGSRRRILKTLLHEPGRLAFENSIETGHRCGHGRERVEFALVVDFNSFTQSREDISGNTVWRTDCRASLALGDCRQRYGANDPDLSTNKPAHLVY